MVKGESQEENLEFGLLGAMMPPTTTTTTAGSSSPKRCLLGRPLLARSLVLRWRAPQRCLTLQQFHFSCLHSKEALARKTEKPCFLKANRIISLCFFFQYRNPYQVPSLQIVSGANLKPGFLHMFPHLP